MLNRHIPYDYRPQIASPSPRGFHQGRQRLQHSSGIRLFYMGLLDQPTLTRSAWIPTLSNLLGIVPAQCP